MSNAFLDVIDSAGVASIVYTKPLPSTNDSSTTQSVLDSIAEADEGGMVPTAIANAFASRFDIRGSYGNADAGELGASAQLYQQRGTDNYGFVILSRRVRFRPAQT